MIRVEQQVHLLFPFQRTQKAATVLQEIVQICGRTAVQLFGRPALCRFVLSLVRQHLEYKAKVSRAQLLETRAAICVRRLVRVERLGPPDEIGAIHQGRWTSKTKSLVVTEKRLTSHLEARNDRLRKVESLPAYPGATQLIAANDAD